MALDLGYYVACNVGLTPHDEHERIYRENVELAQFAEAELGVTTFNLPEHHFIDLLNVPGPLVLGAHLAATTKSANIRTCVVPLPLHNLLRLAGEAALLDNLTQGRFEFGLARGALPYTFKRFGKTVEAGREGFAEAIGLLERLLTETDVVSDGEYYPLQESTTIMPRPYKERAIPIWVGALSRDSIQWAVGRGYNVLTTPLRQPLEMMRKQSEWFYEAVDALDLPEGAQRPRIDMLTQVLVTHSEKELEEGKEVVLEKQRKNGLVQGAETIVAGHEVGNAGDSTMTIEDIEDNLIFGDPETVIQEIQMRDQLGYDGITLDINFHGPDFASAVRNLELFRDEVLPAIRD